MRECASIFRALLLYFDKDVRIPAITFKNANRYCKYIIARLVSAGVSPLSVGFSTAKPPTPVIEDIMIHGYVICSRFVMLSCVVVYPPKSRSLLRPFDKKLFLFWRPTVRGR